MRESITDFTEIQLREIFNKAGLNAEQTERALKDYSRYREAELSFLSVLSYKDLQDLGAEALSRKIFSLVKDGGEIVEDIIRGYLRYLDYKKDIAQIYQETKSWDKVITEAVYSDMSESLESFIDYVEEIYQTKVKDGKHLQKLTGITEETLEGLEETVIGARYCKYSRALEKELQGGAKYKDLLQIKPKDYGLPESWTGPTGSDQYSSILWALSFEYLIHEPGGLMLLPDLRSIAEEVEAPYSVLLDCYNITNRGKKYGATRD